MSAILLICLMALGQTPARDVRQDVQAPSGTASISGSVMTATGVSKPVRLAYVVLIGAETGVLRITSSDDRGRFAFANLPADRYMVGASKAPFLGSVAGAKRPARPGTPIAIKNGETIGDVTIKMPLGAAIAGAITDELGQPAAGVFITLQQRRIQGGERVWTSVPGTIAADERGRYRFYGLTPGDYLVVAMRLGASLSGVRTLSDAEVDAALKGSRIPPALPGDPTSLPAPVYFPGTARVSDATTITVAAGDERSNVDFRLETVRTASLEGTIATVNGQAPAAVTLTLTTASPSNPSNERQFARPAPDGTFKLTNIKPGSYNLVAREGTAEARFASAVVEVNGVDQIGFQLTLLPPLTLSARIAFEGTAAPPTLAGRRIPFRSLAPDGTSGPPPQVGNTAATGAFSITGLLPGQYVIGGPLFFGATTDSVTWTLQSAVADGRDVTDLPLVITADAVPKNVVVTYGDQWQELSGRLRQSSNAAATEYTMVVFPADKKYWLPGSRRILTVRPDSTGQFRVGGPGPITLPAGAYLLAAVTDIERDEQFDPSFLDALVPSAIPVTLAAGQRQVQDVVIK